MAASYEVPSCITVLFLFFMQQKKYFYYKNVSYKLLMQILFMYVIILLLLAYDVLGLLLLYPFPMYFYVVLCIGYWRLRCNLGSGRVASKQLP